MLKDSYVKTLKRSSLSGPLNVLQVPAPQGLITEFYYNFYTPDETTNDSGYGGDFSQNSINGEVLSGGSVSAGDTVNPNHSPETDVEFNHQLERVAPRMVKFRFGIPNIVANPSYTLNNHPQSEQESENNELLLRKFLTNAMDESAVASASPTVNYCTLVLQDDDAGMDIVKQAFFHIKNSEMWGSQTFDSKDFWKNLQVNVNDLFAKDNFVFGNSFIVTETDISDPDYPKDARRAEAVDSSFIKKAVAALNANGFDGTQYFNLSNGDRKGANFRNDLSQVQLLTQINYKVAADIMIRANERAVGPYVDSICVDVPHAIKLQKEARSKTPSKPTIIGENDYDIDMPDITSQLALMINLQEKSDTESPSEAPGTIRALGYVIEKFEILPGGLKKRKATRVLGSTFTTGGIDTRVKIGSTYHYQARTAVLYEYDAIESITGKIYRAKSLMLSRPSNVGVVQCHPSLKPPDPPTDLRFVWDYDNEFLHVFWAFPVEKERDVRYFQVFRRSSIHEPFQLLAEYDFNDNQANFERVEYIRPSLITKMLGNVKTLYTDAQFKKDSVYIYAIVALDAYGQSSSYSDQFVVHFDQSLNKIDAEAISPSRAPKAYPNFFMKSNVGGFSDRTNITEDLIKSSQSKQMTIYFDPEALNVTSNGIKQNHLVFSAKGSEQNFDNRIQYLMQVTNVDRQLTRVIPINLKEL